MSAVNIENGKIVIHVGVVVEQQDQQGEIIAQGNLLDLDKPARQESGRHSIGEGLSLVQDPLGKVRSLAISLMPILGEVMITYGIAKEIFDWYFAPGGPGDLRFKRDITREIDGFLTRQEQHSVRYGHRQVIISSDATFKNLAGQDTNTLRQIREGTGSGLRASALGLQDKSVGWRP